MIKASSLIAIAILILVRFALGQTDGITQAPDERAQRHSTYIQLNRQAFARHDDAESEKVHVSQSDKVSEIRSRLHNLVLEEIRNVLKGSNPSAKDLTVAISTLQGDMSFLSGWGSQGTNTPFGKFFQLGGVRSLAVGYIVLQGGDAIPDTQPYLEFYDDMNGAWEMKAEAPTRSDFRGHTFFVSKMDSSVPGEAWFLAWGTTIGNPGTPMNVRLYAFNGNAVRTVWKRDNLTRGVATVSKDSVTLEYDQEYNSSDPNNRVHETLHVNPNGLQ